MALRILQNQQEAEDVLQESFIKAFTSMSQLQDAKAFGGWLKRIVVNKSINQLNKKGIQWSDQEPQELGSIEEDIVVELPWEKLSVADVKNAMEQLSSGYRAVFALYMFEGESHKEIAEQLMISESTSKSQLNRAKKRIKEILESKWR